MTNSKHDKNLSELNKHFNICLVKKERNAEMSQLLGQMVS